MAQIHDDARHGSGVETAGVIVGDLADRLGHGAVGEGRLDGRDELLALEPPFVATTREELYRRILQGQTTPVSGRNRSVSRDLQVVVGPAEEERDDPRAWPWPRPLTFVAGLAPVELARLLGVKSVELAPVRDAERRWIWPASGSTRIGS